MTKEKDLSNETKAIIASNLTTALSTLVVSGQNEKDATVKIIEWFHILLDQSFPQKEGDYAFPWMRQK